jgi:hypothetical protein
MAVYTLLPGTPILSTERSSICGDWPRFVFLCTLVMIVEDLLTAGGEYKFKAMTKVNKFMYRFQIWQIFLAMGLGAYMWARVYLVVESFISLGHSPAGVYDLPSWSSYVPHIT